MSERTARIVALQQLLHANRLELSDTDAGIQQLNDWFAEHVEADSERPSRLRPIWYAVANDLALFLGEVIIGRCPGLKWEFFTWGKKNASYQRHVIMGFVRILASKYNIDIDRRVTTYGHRLVAGLPVDKDAFLRWIRGAQELA